MSAFDSAAFLATCSVLPGVYRFYNEAEKLLYVGKAANLKKRLASYFRAQGLSSKTTALVSHIARIEITVTANETDALLLEHNLIKEWRPPYNVLLRDDKSYPYLYLSTEQAWPRLSVHRGARRGAGRYFGPYPNSQAVRETLAMLQATFNVRSCEDSEFNHRSRPCLQYQIGRCKAPCTGLVSAEIYADDVRRTLMFLEGKNDALLQELASRMELAAQRLDFEHAADLRDRIARLRRIQQPQSIEGAAENTDVLALARLESDVCIHLLHVRDGRVLGGKNFFPRLGVVHEDAEILAAFVAQHYLNANADQLPQQLLLNYAHDDNALVYAALKQRFGWAPRLQTQARDLHARWQNMALTNAQQALHTQHAHQANYQKRLAALQQRFELHTPPQRLECFDISHASGEATVASCVVFGQSGPLNSEYRRFNIENVTPGDDFAAMEQALTRRFANTQTRPDVLFIDGGTGQTRIAHDILHRLNLQDICLIGVAKGASRKPGLEVLHLDCRGATLTLSPQDPALLLIQHIRDEAHRFAITGHRQRRDKARRRSTLEDIPGIGPKRRRELLRYFGGLVAVTRASIDEIARVPGISRKLAEQIHATLHSE